MTIPLLIFEDEEYKNVEYDSDVIMTFFGRWAVNGQWIFFLKVPNVDNSLNVTSGCDALRTNLAKSVA